VRFAAVALGILVLLAASRGHLPWPLPEDNGVTSSFGDPRASHLHAGIDLSTDGRDGLPVRAVADGEIVRLKVEWRGYGNALYIRHTGGEESMYGHLERFENGRLHLGDVVARAQAEKKTRYPGNIDVTPPVRVRRGDIIAWSGETGVGLPHLHFEWRARDGTQPLDPLRAGLLASALRPEVVITSVFSRNRGLCVAAHAVFRGHRFAVNRLRVGVDGNAYYGLDLTRVDFETYLLPGAIFDLEASEETHSPVFSLDAVGASVWPGQVRGGGPIAPGKHSVEVEARDASGASARWSGLVEVREEADAQPAETKLTAETAVGSFRLELPNGTLHPATRVALAATSDGVEISPSWETPRPGARLVFLPSERDAGARRRLGLYRAGAALDSEGAATDAAEIVGHLHRFGRFVVREDTTPPKVVNLRRERCFFGPCLRVDVSDDRSGFGPDSVVFSIAGREVLADVDPDRGWATAPAPPDVELSSVGVSARDVAGNSAEIRVQVYAGEKR
jgi:hypothetical protein